MRGDTQQAEVHQRAGGDTRCQAEHRAQEQGAGVGAAGGDAVEEQDHFRAFAQHGESNHQREHAERTGAGANVVADRFHFAGDFGAVLLHPDAVPSQHQDREPEDRRVQYFLPDALESCCDGLRAASDEQ